MKGLSENNEKSGKCGKSYFFRKSRFPSPLLPPTYSSVFISQVFENMMRVWNLTSGRKEREKEKRKGERGRQKGRKEGREEGRKEGKLWLNT